MKNTNPFVIKSIDKSPSYGICRGHVIYPLNTGERVHFQKL